MGKKVKILGKLVETFWSKVNEEEKINTNLIRLCEMS